MDNQNPLVNIGDIAKPATTLIEKISDAISGIFRPSQIKRVATAQAEAKKILAYADMEVESELERRAVARMIREEARRQENMETIFRNALPEFPKEAPADQIDTDWISNFFDKCRLVSDIDMQILWSKVLSGQANSPGSYSKRTLEILANLEKSDALLFSKICSYAIHWEDDIVPLIYDTKHKIYLKEGISFDVLSHFDSLGLLHFDNLAGFVMESSAKKQVIRYFDQPITIIFNTLVTTQGRLEIGNVLLTKAGKELARICNSEPISYFIKYLEAKWKDFGHTTQIHQLGG